MTDTPEPPDAVVAPEEDEFDEAMPPEDIAPARVAHPGQYGAKKNRGCLYQVLFFVVMAALGVYLTSVFRNGGGTPKTVVGKGTSGSVAWKVEAYTDTDDSRCIFLIVNGDEETPLTGGCISPQGTPTGDDVHEAQLPGRTQWIVFGLATKGTGTVRLPLTDNTTHSVSANPDKHVTDLTYLYVPPPGVHTSASAVFG